MIDFSRIIRCQIPAGNVSQIDVNGKKTWISGKRYGFKREKANPDPYERITYIYDAEGMTPMTVNLTTNVADYGSWAEFVDEVCRPVFLNYDGTVDHELDHNDQTKRLDGTASYAGDKTKYGNAMVEFRKYKWIKRYEDDVYQYVIFSDTQIDPEYKAYAHTNEGGECLDAFYWAMFENLIYNNNMRSIGSSSTVNVSKSIADRITYATNCSPGWNIAYKSGWDYICDLLTLLGKSDDAQTVFGEGKTSGTASDTVKSGSLRQYGAFWGSSNNTKPVKTLYIENFWGNVWEGMHGLILNKTEGFKIKMTPPYNTTGVGYTDFPGSSESISGYVVESINSNETGYLPTVLNGTSSTYMCDQYLHGVAQVRIAHTGGRYDFAKKAGPRTLSLNLTSAASTDTAARLSYLRPPDNKMWTNEWVCKGDLPKDNGWSHIASPGSITYGETHGPAVKMTCTNGTSSDQGVALRLSDYTLRYGQKCALEVEILAEQLQSDSGGIRIILGSGTAAGAAATKGIKITINHNTSAGKAYLNVLQTTDVIGTQRKSKEFSLNEWHTVRLEIDTISGVNTVYLDGEPICTQSNSQLSTMDTNNTWLNVKNGVCWCRALRYRKNA